MATLIQCQKVAMLHKEGYVSIDPYAGMDTMEIPIGGPVFLKSPQDNIVKVMPDGSIIEIDVSELGI